MRQQRPRNRLENEPTCPVTIRRGASLPIDPYGVRRPDPFGSAATVAFDVTMRDLDFVATYPECSIARVVFEPGSKDRTTAGDN